MSCFKSLIVIAVVFVTKVATACQCPITSLSDQELLKYDIIFKGKINAIKLSGANSEAIYSVDELYKGNISQDFHVFFDDKDNCKLELRVGDEWIIYTNYRQIDNAKLDFCSRSRKFIKNIKEDFFAVTTGVSYDEELLFLQTKLGLHKLLKNNPNRVENRNIIPTSNQFIIVLICSLLGIIFFYWIFNKIFK